VRRFQLTTNKSAQRPKNKSIDINGSAAAYYLKTPWTSNYSHSVIHRRTGPIHSKKKWTADVILNGVPDKSKVTLKEVRNAGHFHSLVRFHQQWPNFLPSTDQEV
jgi:hypothetical protein